MEKHDYLMIAGPSELAPESQLAMAQPMIPHYGEAWTVMNRRVLGKLKKVFQTKNEIYVIPGSSSAVMEAAVNSVIEPGTEVLVELSGFFGHRFKEIVESCGGQAVPLPVSFGQAVDPEAVRAKLKANPRIRAMTIVHNESSTGVTNPVAEVAAVCRERGVLLVCDTVSSMGGIDIRTDEWGLDYCLTGNQKCLQSPPGLGIICLSDEAWKRIDGRKTPVAGWFLNLANLRRYCENWKDWHGHGPVTAPTAIYAALEAALDLILEEGLQRRFARHSLNARACRAGLRAGGLRLFAADEVASNTITSFVAPDGVDKKQIMAILKQEFNILISGTPGDMGVELLRIGHMGVTSHRNAVITTVAAIMYACGKLGAAVEAGQALEAILEVYRSQPAGS